MKRYMIKKNLFIFRQYPEIFSIDDSYLIIGNQEYLKKLNLQDFDNIFTIFHTPIWVKNILNKNQINIIQLNENGEVLKAYLHKKFQPIQSESLKVEYGFFLLKQKAKVIDKLFKTKEAQSLLDYTLPKRIDLSFINENLDFFIKAIIMDTLKLNYKLTNKRAKEITNILFNLTENIVSYSFYNKFIEEEIYPEEGFLNKKSPSLIRDFTEIQRIKFMKKVKYLITSRFFDGKDLNRKYFPNTVVRYLKILSTYFFYGNRFKRSKKILYLIEKYKRGEINEIFNRL